MWKEAVKLELTKRKISFIVPMLLLGVASFVYSFLVSSVVTSRQYTTGEVLVLMWPFLFAAASVFSAVILPPASAIGLRQETNRGAEEVLPVSCFARVASAYLAILFQLLCFLIPFLLFFIVTGKSRLSSVTYGSFLLLYFHLLAFTLAYWWNQALLAAGAAIFSTVGMATILAIWDLFDMQKWRSPVVIAATALLVPCLLLLSKNIERGRKLKHKNYPAFLILAGLVLPLVVLAFPPGQERELMPVREEMSHDGRLSALTGTLLTTQLGSLVQVSRDGTRQVVWQAPGLSLWEILRNLGENEFARFGSGRAFQIMDVIVDHANNTWVIYEYGQFYRILKQEPGKSIKLYTTLGKKHMDLHYSSNMDAFYKADRYCSVLARFLPAQDQPAWCLKDEDLSESSLQSWTERGDNGSERASLRDDWRTLVEEPSGQRWPLPGEGILPHGEEDLLPDFSTPEGKGYVLPVLLENLRFELVLCFPNGIVFSPWSITWEFKQLEKAGATFDVKAQRTRIPGGGAVWQVADTCLLIDRNGTAYPPLRIEDVYAQSGVRFVKEYSPFDPLRLDKGRVWGVLRGNIHVQVDLETSRVIRSLQLPFSTRDQLTRSSHLIKEGIYYLANDHIYLVTWEGELRDLGPARL